MPTSHRSRAALDAVVRESRTPGIQYLVVDADGTLFEYAGGWADLSSHRPMTLGTTMMAYSMSKTITAAAALQLVEARKIALDDAIDRYIESPYGPQVTVRHLLSHTSGIPNPIPLRWVHAVENRADFREDAALAAVLQKHGRLSAPPGTKYVYSNIGYWILGPILERVSGESFIDYVRNHVLDPLGIAPEALGYAVVNPATHATGYLEKFSLFNLIKRFLIDAALIGEYEGPWLRIRAHYANGPAFGGLVGAARAFAAFLRDQLRPHSCLFDVPTRNLFYEPQQTETGTPIAMTLGWHVGAADGARFFYKEGGGGGFDSMMRIYPAAGVGTVGHDQRDRIRRPSCPGCGRSGLCELIAATAIANDVRVGMRPVRFFEDQGARLLRVRAPTKVWDSRRRCERHRSRLALRKQRADLFHRAPYLVVHEHATQFNSRRRRVSTDAGGGLGLAFCGS